MRQNVENIFNPFSELNVHLVSDCDALVISASKSRSGGPEEVIAEDGACWGSFIKDVHKLFGDFLTPYPLFHISD